MSAAAAPPDEEVIWSSPITKGFFKKTVVREQQITNYRVIQGSGYVGLHLLDDIMVMNQRRISDSSYTSVGGGRYSPRIGTGRPKSRTVGDLAFIYQGKPVFIFHQITDPHGVARLAKAARKRLLDMLETKEKNNKAQLREEQRQRRQQLQQQQNERINLRAATKPTTSNTIITCPRCSSINTRQSRYCSNCGFRFADASEEERIIMNQRQSLSSPSSSPSSMIKTAGQYEGNFMAWQSPAHGIKINYPSNWRVEKGKQATTIVLFKSPKESSSDIIFENVVIAVYNIPYGTLEELVPHFINQNRKKFVDFTLIETAPTKLGGRQAHRLVFDAEGKRFLSVYVVEKNKVYNIGYVSIPSKFGNYLPIVQRMLDSFEITGQ